jgi:translation initiation factor RLI1
MSIDNKRKVFLIVSGDPERTQIISDFISKHYSSPTVYMANSPLTALQKISNAHIDIVLTENNLKMTETIILENSNPHMAIMVIGDKP